MVLVVVTVVKVALVPEVGALMSAVLALMLAVGVEVGVSVTTVIAIHVVAVVLTVARRKGRRCGNDALRTSTALELSSKIQCTGFVLGHSDLDNWTDEFTSGLLLLVVT